MHPHCTLQALRLIVHLGEPLPELCLSLALPDLFDQSCLVLQSQALRLIMHLGEPLPEARPAWEFPLGATLPFFLLTFAIMCYTNGVGASTGGCRGAAQVVVGCAVHLGNAGRPQYAYFLIVVGAGPVGWAQACMAKQAGRQGDGGICCSLAVCTCAFPRPPPPDMFAPPSCQYSCLFVMWIVFCLPPPTPRHVCALAGGRRRGRPASGAPCSLDGGGSGQQAACLAGGLLCDRCAALIISWHRAQLLALL